MKIYLILTAILSLIMMTFPVIPLVYSSNTHSEQVVQAMAHQTSEIYKTDTDKNADKNIIRVLRTSSGKVIDVELFDYVCGALSAEMPLSFHDEALKAQAIACYTYALWIKNNADNAPNELSDLSDSPSSHQGFLDKKQMKEKWGDKYEENYSRIKNIVSSVIGQYIVYNNEPIMAVYHSLSGGITESAENAWGTDISYLQSVSAPGDKLSPDFRSTKSISYEEFDNLIQNIENINFNYKEKRLGTIECHESGYVSSVEIYAQRIDSRQLRGILGLKSSFFTIKYNDSSIVFTVSGNGHGVGMSQYSADYMARQGSSYKEILAHFYKNTTITGS